MSDERREVRTSHSPIALPLHHCLRVRTTTPAHVLRARFPLQLCVPLTGSSPTRKAQLGKGLSTTRCLNLRTKASFMKLSPRSTLSSCRLHAFPLLTRRNCILSPELRRIHTGFTVCPASFESRAMVGPTMLFWGRSPRTPPRIMIKSRCFYLPTAAPRTSDGFLCGRRKAIVQEAAFWQPKIPHLPISPYPLSTMAE